MTLEEGSERVGRLLRQILAEATALKHVGTRTTRPYAESIVEKAEQALSALDCAAAATNPRDGNPASRNNKGVE